MVYNTLEAGIFERGIKKVRIAKALGISPRSLYNKMCGIAPFTWPEVCVIQETFFPDIQKEKLFMATDKSAS